MHVSLSSIFDHVYAGYLEAASTCPWLAQLSRLLSVPYAGPNTLVGLAKKEGISRTDLVKRLLPAYSQVLKELKALGVPEVQIHEPILTVADADELESDFNLTYAEFAKTGLFINLVTYYDDIGSTYQWVVK